ncbi:MAG TPA: acyl-CoA thioesterase [Oligoflexia bacterium]|nr:acyl-CoA thioesterase [Oligoflexia bacterium]HMR23965.1 acyl-CoA thioesterase [Oligoflexia bacterium]
MSNHIIFEYPTTIQEAQLDSFGHLNNAVYLQLFEFARWEFISQRGFGLEKIQETKTGPVILAINIKYHKELKARDKVIIKSQMQSFKPKIGELRQWIENDKGDLCCDAILTMGFWDTQKRKLIHATDEWKEAIGIDKKSYF